MISIDDVKAYAKEGYGRGVFNSTQFNQDFSSFSSTKRKINRFLKSSKVDEKVVINSIIMSLNVFGKEKVNKIFRVILDDVQFSVVKAVLMFLRQYDYSLGQEVYPNRIMVDILRFTQNKYVLGIHE